MKKKIIMASLVILSAFGSTALMAQDQSMPATQQATPATGQPVQARQMPSAADRAKKQTDRLNEQVQLTPDQYAKVLQINTDFQTQRDATSSAGPKQPLTPEQRDQMRNAAKGRMDKINAVLTPEQQQKMQDSKMRPAPSPTPTPMAH